MRRKKTGICKQSYGFSSVSLKNAIAEKTGLSRPTATNGIRNAVENVEDSPPIIKTPTRTASKATVAILIQAALLNQLEAYKPDALK